MTPYALHVVDVIAFIVVLLSAVLASFRGFTREFFGIASWLVSLFFATYATEKTFGFWVRTISAGGEVSVKVSLRYS